ncbi:MAG: hypothetical protein KDA61_16405, partial [Planctomycetales bacterium]|nr:hypothetical protein [Planctomycetales bacterium]
MMHSRFIRRWFVYVVALTAGVGCLESSDAADYEWLPTGQGDFHVAENWSSDFGAFVPVWE